MSGSPYQPYHAQHATYPGYNGGFYAPLQQAWSFQRPPHMHVPPINSPGYPGGPYFTPPPENSTAQLHPFGMENENRGFQFGPRMRNFLPWNQSDTRAHNGFQISVGERCPNKVNGFSCWEPCWQHRETNVEEQLCNHLSDLLEHSRERLLKKRQCLPTMSCGVFMVGYDESQAQQRFVISCNDRHICKELTKIFKKHSLEREYMGFKPLITTSFPRSQTPLQRLPERKLSENSIASESIGTMNSGVDIALSSDDDDSDSIADYILSSSRRPQHDVFLRGLLLGRQTLVLPAAVSIGSGTSSHQAVISGLVTLQSRNRTYALTVAHAIPSPEKATSASSRSFDSSNSNGRKIGSVVRSSIGMRDGLDWALIELNDKLDFCTLAPYPTRLASDTDFLALEVNGYKQVYIKTARSLISGCLLLNPYYIRPEGEDQFMHVWMVELDDPIQIGDCGAWVVGVENQEFYGYIAFGHPGDKYAYIISAPLIFQQIGAKMSDQVVPCASGPTFKTSAFTRDHRESYRQQSRGNRRPFPPDPFQNSYTAPHIPQPSTPWGYQGFYPQPYQPNNNPLSEISTPEESKAPSISLADLAKDETIARLEKLILDERVEREARDIARLKAVEEAAREKAAREEQLAREQKIAEEAAALARRDVAAAEVRIARLEVAVKKAEETATQGTPSQREYCIVQ